METSGKIENEDLLRQLQTCQLNLSEATKSMRELQLENQQLKEIMAHTLETGRKLQVGPHLARARTDERDIETVLQSHNPYVVVLIDGDGLLV